MNTRFVAVVCFAALAACQKETPSNPVKKDEAPRASVAVPAPAAVAEAPTLLPGPPAAPPTDSLALPHDPSEPVNHLNRSRELAEAGDRSGALIEARRALFDDPKDPEVLEAIALLAERSGKKEIAVLALERLARLDEEEAAPLERMARLLLALKRYDEALKAGREAIVRDPVDPDAYQVTGRALLARGELTPAIQMFEQVTELSANHGHAWNNLGYACLLANEDQAAVDALTRAAELLPGVAYVQNNLGIALERTGRLDEAMRAFTVATEISPKYVKAKLNLQRLEQLASTGEMPDQQELDDGSADVSPGIKPTLP